MRWGCREIRRSKFGVRIKFEGRMTKVVGATVLILPGIRLRRPMKWVCCACAFLSLAGGLSACDRDSGRSTAPAPVNRSSATRAATRESWMADAPAKWPQFVLTNKATFSGHTALGGASAFLVRVPDGRVLAATAKHLIGEAGGVEPE